METMNSLRDYTTTQISPLLAKPIKPLLKLGFVPKPNLHYIVSLIKLTYLFA